MSKRISIRNILFATDFSVTAEAAVPYALQFARLYGSKVRIAHVTARAGEWGRTHEKEVELLHKQFQDVPHEIVVEEGDPRRALLSLVDATVDLVVVGTHGRTGLGRVLLGSVAETIFREVSCPVLTVGPRLATDPKWSLQIREILYAVDLNNKTPLAADHAISLAQETQARLTILNVVPEPEPGDLVHAEQFAETTRRQLKALIPADAEAWCQPNCVVEQGDAAEKILDVAGRYHASLIVLGVRPRSQAQRPISHRVIAGASCPVLTVRG